MTNPITTIYQFTGSTGKVRRGLILEKQDNLAKIMLDDDADLKARGLNDIDRILYSAHVTWTYWETYQEGTNVALLPVGTPNIWNNALIGKVAGSPSDTALIDATILKLEQNEQALRAERLKKPH